MSNNLYFNEAYWQEAIKSPGWYIEYVRLLARVSIELSKEPERLSKLNKSVRSFFEQALLNDEVNLAKNGPDFDKERQQVDMIVIHHTSAQPGYRLDYMNAVHLLNIYVPNFASQLVKDEILPKTPIWSGHIKDGRQVFWAYHWLMRMDGTSERLLEDNQLGWHAGNWEINKRSIGICLDNDYDKKDPSDEILKKLAGHIRKHYPQIKPEDIIGHKEAREGTTCPGNNFLDIWKTQLINYIVDLQ